MGWLEYHIDKSPKAELDSLYCWSKEGREVNVLRSCMKGSVYYGAVEIKENGARDVIAVICLTHYSPKSYYNFAYKNMDETWLPYHCDCPESILALLTHTDNEGAIEWRRRCRAKIETRKKLSSLKVGDVIQFISMYDMQSGIKQGEIVRLSVDKKWGSNRKEFRGYGYRWSAKYIPANFEIISRG